MDTKTEKPQKVNAGYRLPKPLYKWVKDQANREDILPCEFVERVLDEVRRREEPEPATA